MVDDLEASRAHWGDLKFLSIHSVSPRPGDIEAALDGTFRHHDESFTLSPPVDWWDEPYRGTNERGFFQNSFVFADPLLYDRRFPEVLTPLAAIFADWLAANPQSEPSHPHRYAWHDHAAAGRIVAMAFVLREGTRRGSFDRGIAEALAAGVLEHAAYLLADANYAAHNNHGFASDAALTLAARSLTPAPPTKGWADVAERRFAAVLDHMIDRSEAMHLEHSPSYHWIIRGALARFATGGLFSRFDLTGLTERMEESGAWLIAPDGTLPPLGDTQIGQRPPSSTSVISESRQGMKVFPASGYAVVRTQDSALIITAAHHPTAHKHADDGSFCLYEGGRAIILDSGNPGYEYDSPEFSYGTSPAAHATICVDGFDWTKNAPPYGTGILAAVEQDGVYALLTRNPGAAPGGGAARRVLVYAPARFLLVLDDVDAGGDSRLARHLPLAPGLTAEIDERCNVEISAEDSPVARLIQVLARGAVADNIDIVCGQRKPELQGFRFITPERPLPSTDITLSSSGGEPKAFALLLDSGDTIDLPSMTWNRELDRLDIEVTGITSSALVIHIDEGAVALNFGG